jgi:hypothetical protein
MHKLIRCTIFFILLLVISSFFSCKRIFDPVSVVPKIAYRSFTNPNMNVFIMDMDGSNKVNLTKNRYYAILNIRFFPDG